MSKKLKPCPICGEELKVHGPEDWSPSFYDPDSGGDPYNAECACGFYFSCGSYENEDFLKAINRRAEPETGNPATENGCEWCAGETQWQPDVLDGCKGGYRKPKFCPECGKKQDAADHIGEVTEMMQAAPSNATVKTLKEYYDDFKTPEELRKPGYDRNDPKGSVME